MSLYNDLSSVLTPYANKIKQNEANVRLALSLEGGGAPIVVTSASAMTDTAQIYVLSTDGNWYYHNGSAWVAGGEYGGVATGSITTDKLADGAVTTAKIADGAVTAGKIANGVVPTVDATLSQSGAAADAKTVGDRLTAVEVNSALLTDEIPNTVQTYTFANGQVSQIVHKRNNSTIRTDVFTYSAAAIVETRTLNSGEVLAISTNLSTLETSVTYTAA